MDSRFAVRLGLRMVKGLGRRPMPTQIGPAGRPLSPFGRRISGAAPTVCPYGCPDRRIAEADGFHAPSALLAAPRPSGAIKGLPDHRPARLFAALEGKRARRRPAPDDLPAARWSRNTSRTGLSLRRHPVAFLRGDLARRRILTCTDAMALPNRRWAEVAGLVLVRQRPGSAKGTMFITLEDETGIANLVVWPKVFEANRRIILAASMIAARGNDPGREGEVLDLLPAAESRL
ncbi:Dnae2p [Pleodorina starrii]|uniref:Dnae2p n=1 Tax=Pleodorina starrii TaxID=330485 RepID=A0A9W6C363_9CHLO|nr:Dnae2p [Pleodorina starrii]